MAIRVRVADIPNVVDKASNEVSDYVDVPDKYIGYPARINQYVITWRHCENECAEKVMRALLWHKKIPQCYDPFRFAAAAERDADMVGQHA